MDFQKVNKNECFAYEVCVEICPFEVIKIENNKVEIRIETRRNCSICLMACPVGAFL